jgi:16S rRNA (adenine1518-N6/adenine1519-N6)-dimethyltransferase
MSSRGQTLSYLTRLLAGRGLRPHTGLGQNFLIDLNLQDLLVDRAELSRADLVLEVGAGTGGLTQRLVAAAGWVLAVEVDRGLFELARSNVAATNVTWLCHDILEKKSALNGAVLQALDTAWGQGGFTARKLVANLPYQVATPLIVNLLTGPMAWDRLVVTVQREVADRMTAEPMCPEYGGLAVVVQALADVEIFRVLPPSAFWPRPQVASAMVAIRPNLGKRAAVGDVGAFHALVRGVWLHRRKNLRTALYLASKKLWDKTTVNRFLTEVDVDGDVRAESLGVAEFIELARQWRSRGPGGSSGGVENG